MLVVLTAFESPLSGATCNVPGDRPTLGQAVSDPVCNPIVLAAQTFVESIVISRSLTLAGSTTSTSTIQGIVAVQGDSTDVVMTDLRIDTTATPLAGCVALSVSGGAHLEPQNVDVSAGGAGLCESPFEIFADGFESGSTGAWSAKAP